MKNNTPVTRFGSDWRYIPRTEYEKYAKTLPKAEAICIELLGEPKTHAEWADRFNKVGAINKIISKI